MTVEVVAPGMDHDGSFPQPSIEEKGMTTMRLHRLHFSSSPCPHTLAISCPHSQRVSRVWSRSNVGVFVIVMIRGGWIKIENDY